MIYVYLTLADGTFLYEPLSHALRFHSPEDLRSRTGLQDFVGDAALNLVYVGRGDQINELSTQDRRLYAAVDAGFIGQNVHLFCASEGLVTVFRNSIDFPTLEKCLKLGPGQFVAFAQTVGYPASRD